MGIGNFILSRLAVHVQLCITVVTESIFFYTVKFGVGKSVNRLPNGEILTSDTSLFPLFSAKTTSPKEWEPHAIGTHSLKTHQSDHCMLPNINGLL